MEPGGHETTKLPNERPPLSRQRMDQPVTCSANSLINALLLNGAAIPPGDAQALVNKTLETKSSLSSADQAAFARMYGFELGIWKPNNTTPEDVATQFAELLQRGPAVVTISSTFSKRDKTVLPEVALRDNPQHAKMVEERSGYINHRVAAMRDGSTVKLVDGYNPDDPEIFDMDNAEERKRLTAWLMSSLIQHEEGTRNQKTEWSQASKEALEKLLLEWNTKYFTSYSPHFIPAVTTLTPVTSNNLSQ